METVFYANSSKEAWDLMREKNAHGYVCGYPSLQPDEAGRYTVRALKREEVQS